MQNKEIGGEKSVNEKNLELFNRYFPGCLSMENDGKLTLDTGRLKALLGDFSEIKEEGYGLDFVGKKIALNQAFKKNNKILKPLNESTSKHILIKGDNLDALKILKQSYSEKIKMIYIDPPYNTKNDSFIYSDDFSQSNEEVLKTLDYSKEKLDYITNLFGSKCHSGWLSFMYPRLLLAKDLLKQDGVIFISIDDNEAAQLKLLCDEIFGEGNFLSLLSVVDNLKGNNNTDGIVNTHEYCLIYAKNKDLHIFKDMLVDENEDELMKWNIDEYGYWKEGRNIKGTGENAPREKRPSMFYPIYLSDDLEISLEKSNKYHIEVLPLTNGKEVCWNWGKDFLQANKHELIVKKVGDNYNFIKKQRPLLGDLPSKKMKTTCYKPKYSTSVSSATLKQLFGEPIFNYSKSIYFIYDLIQIATNENDIILDFFAGSGTTAHAVLESNKSNYQKLSEGGGGLFNGLNTAFKERRFILVQLDEKIDPKKNKSTHDFCLNTLKSPSPSIFDITEERIKRAGAKIKEACPYLDVGFRAFEIIDDETHDKNLNEANQKDLFAYSNPKKRETQTILIKLLCCEGLELTTPITCLIENALYLALNTAFIVGDIEMSEVLENLKDKGVEKISMYMPAISNDRLCLELGSNLLDLKLESSDLKIRG
ncbi:site-specific DNA-methyltransferase [Helicobacter pylori]|uniref:site-specific DNA-methyltransferase n=1 Tax=Helicobacter pylori TaxID=210 RepID=UPI001FD178FD|nr:site-specific DNA-methyltransferase [Helicobacter pylori]UOS63664.1 site-specific DNA-methyltransferase [Helicobacter pylori]